METENIEDEELLNENNVSANDDRLACTAFISTGRIDVLKRPLKDILNSLAEENDEAIQPLFVLPIKNALKLIFPSPETRKKAVNDKLSIFNLRVEVELPRKPEVRVRRAVYVYGVPIDEKDESIADHLKKNGMEPVSGFLWTKHKGTPFRNGGRSVMVMYDREKEVPGYQRFYSNVLRRPVTIRLWYFGMPVWCRRCMGKGHMAKGCTVEIASTTTITTGPDGKASYASAAAGRKPSAPVVLDTRKDGEPPMETLSSQTTIIQRNRTDSNSSIQAATATVPKTSTQPPPVKSNYLPFFGSVSFLSNHHPCRIMIGNVEYKSPEHFLFSEKAKIAGRADIREQIMNAHTAVIARALGKNVDWDEEKYGPWIAFVKQALKEANSRKYEQHANLRQRLFETSPSILVEANPHDSRWGVGLKRTDVGIHDPTKWKGENILGYMLTRLRDEMMNYYPSERPDPMETNRPGGVNKRQRPESGDDGSDDAGPPTSKTHASQLV